MYFIYQAILSVIFWMNKSLLKGAKVSLKGVQEGQKLKLTEMPDLNLWKKNVLLIVLYSNGNNYRYQLSIYTQNYI